jgi:hypothetical protein
MSIDGSHCLAEVSMNSEYAAEMASQLLGGHDSEVHVISPYAQLHVPQPSGSGNLEP